MQRGRLCVWLFLLSLSLQLWGGERSDTLRVMCYNVENLFDCMDDSLKEDAEFLPVSVRRWTPSRYWRKLVNISRVIAAAGGDRMPALIGLCEVENDTVLTDLTRRTPLRTAGYRYLITDSPDRRGVDVALLYLPEAFLSLSRRDIRVSGGDRPTRDILHVTGLISTADTLDLFVCHLPSRFGGTRQSTPFRLQTARLLRQAIDSLSAVRQTPRVIVMGDFNDTFLHSPLCEALGISDTPPQGTLSHDTSSHDTLSSVSPLLLHDILTDSESHSPLSPLGSYYYKGKWELIDHILVSGTLLTDDAPVRALPRHSRVLRLPFLLEEEGTFGDQKPFRTYQGMRYLGGYSDHLPLVSDLVVE